MIGRGVYGKVIINADKNSVFKLQDPMQSFASILRECVILGNLSHDRIVKIKDVDFVDKLIRIELPLYYPLTNMQNLITNKMQIIYDLFDGLQYLHSMGIMHRDIKEQNLLIARTEDRTLRLMICDFGLAAFIGTGDYMIETSSPAYRAPEAWSAAYDQRIDVWSAGIVMFKLLTGIHPYTLVIASGIKDWKSWLMGNPDNITVVLLRLFKDNYKGEHAAFYMHLMQNIFTVRMRRMSARDVAILIVKYGKKYNVPILETELRVDEHSSDRGKIADCVDDSHGYATLIYAHLISDHYQCKQLSTLLAILKIAVHNKFFINRLNLRNLYMK